MNTTTLPSDSTRAWLKAGGLVALTWVAIVALLFPTFISMVGIWDSSETYTHGYIVLPISLWLIWRQRHVVMTTPTAPDLRALIAVFGLAGLWLAADIVGAGVVAHYSLVGLALASVWALLGWALIRALFFPLAFLLLMVPSGDSLIPHLINFTADFTVGTLRLMGFAVYREGTFFSMPSGDWSVVEACSGIRYFLSSIVLGWLYAYLTYRSWKKRLIFGIAAIIVPIIANGFRALLIVLIGHYSGMTLAVGVDHLVYGWVWFGIVMLIMFWVGNRWRDDDAPPPFNAAALTSPKLAWPMAISLLCVIAAFQFYAHHLNSRTPLASPLAQLTPQAGWIETTPISTWQPRWQGMDDQRSISLVKDGQSAMLYMAWYGAQRPSSKLISSVNVLVHESNEAWRRLSETSREVQIGEERLIVREALVDSKQTGQKMLVWYWNRVAGKNVANPFRVKLDMAWQKLLGRHDAGAVIILAAPYTDKPEQAERTLKTVAADHIGPLSILLDQAR